MAVIIIPIIVWFLSWLQRMIYRKFWSKNLEAQVSFSDATITAGNEAEVVERMANAKILPLPWVHLKFEVLRNGKTNEMFRNDLFNILFHQQIIRKSKMKFEKRGIYQIQRLNLLSYDLFITKKLYRIDDNAASLVVFPKGLDSEDFHIPYEKLMGEIATRRYTLEDPFLFKGIREYQPNDSFKNINFKASARNRRWLVNTHEYTLDQKVRILLLTDKTYAFIDENEYETGLRYAAELTGRLERSGIPVSFESNGLDSLEGTEPRMREGCSEQHVDSVLETLARLDVMATGTRGTALIRAMAEQPDVNEYYVIISPDHTGDILKAYQELRDVTPACMFICPLDYRTLASLPTEEKQLEETVENFFYYKA